MAYLVQVSRLTRSLPQATHVPVSCVISLLAVTLKTVFLLWLLLWFFFLIWCSESFQGCVQLWMFLECWTETSWSFMYFIIMESPQSFLPIRTLSPSLWFFPSDMSPRRVSGTARFLCHMTLCQVLILSSVELRWLFYFNYHVFISLWFFSKNYLSVQSLDKILELSPSFYLYQFLTHLFSILFQLLWMKSFTVSTPNWNPFKMWNLLIEKVNWKKPYNVRNE